MQKQMSVVATPVAVAFKCKTTASAEKFTVEGVTPRTGGFVEEVTLAAKKLDGTLVPKALAAHMMDTYLGCIGRELRAGNNVTIRELGSFRLIVRNTREGKRIVRLKFVPSKKLRDDLATEIRA